MALTLESRVEKLEQQLLPPPARFEWLKTLSHLELNVMLEVREALDERGCASPPTEAELAWLTGGATLTHEELSALLWKVTGKRLVPKKHQCFPARPPEWEIVDG